MMKRIDTIIIQEAINTINFGLLGIEQKYPINDIEIIVVINGKEEIRKKLEILNHQTEKFFDGVLNISGILWTTFSDIIEPNLSDKPPIISIGLVQCEYKFQKYVKEIYANIHPVFEIDDLRIFSGESVSNITVAGGDLTKKISLSTHGNIDEIRINGIQNIKIKGVGNKSNKLVLNDLKDNQVINILGMNIEDLSIVNIDTKIPEVKILKQFILSNGTIDKINFQGWSFSRINVGDLNFNGVKISGGFFGYISFERFYLSTSNLSNVHISEIVFPDNQNNFTIIDSVIQNNIFSNVIWGNYFSEFDGKHKISYGGLKETYRMIKHQYDEIGNKTEANKFFAKEMEYHMKTLNEAGNIKDYWIALLQKEVSDFGNDWVRAFTWYVIFTLLCYSIYSGIYFFSQDWVNSWSIERFMIELSRLTRAVNPLPKVEDITNPLLLIFSIFKILIVYQIVVALRRISQR